MSDSSGKTKTTKSGITTTASGDRHIPSSKRADGSVRKEIRVRPGYRPPEDVEVYKNRTAEAWKSRGSGGVPGASYVAPTPKASAPKVKSKEKPPEQQSAPQEEEPAQPVDPEAQREKEAKKLSKKLRQAKELEQKKDTGGSLLPEQLEKVVRINELVRQLDLLGFDVNGNKKD